MGAVVTPHHIATKTGLDILDQGGNAIDAAVAANAALATVAPETCGIGGDLFALIWDGKQVRCLDASGVAGSGADASRLRDEGLVRIPIHHPFTVTVPGCVAGWQALVERFGTLPLAQLLTSASDLAGNGFPASTELARALSARSDQLLAQTHGDEMFVGGVPPASGDLVTRPALKSSLDHVRIHGWRGFYEGPIAEAISTATGGCLSADDLRNWTPEWVDPLALHVLGRTGWTVPPSSQGYLSLATLAVFESLDPPEDPLDPDFTHLLIEAYRINAASRDEVLSDRDTLPREWGNHFNRGTFSGLADKIDRTVALPHNAVRPVPGGTAFLCAADGEGRAIALIQSNFSGIGSGLAAAGFFLHNRGAGFDLRPGHPNELKSGRRPLHTLSPSMWTRDGRFDAIIGTRGGHQQPQLIAQMAALIFHANLAPAQAMDMPRWTTEDWQSGRASKIEVESRFDLDVVAELRKRGHQVRQRNAYEGGWGPVAVIRSTPEGWHGIADPRVDTAAAAALVKRP